MGFRKKTGCRKAADLRDIFRVGLRGGSSLYGLPIRRIEMQAEPSGGHSLTGVCMDASDKYSTGVQI
jgi:hypothetical protein